MLSQVDGLYAWPYDGPFAPASTALLVIDMQRDHLDPKGWLAVTGGNFAPLAAIVPKAAQALALARAAGLFVAFTVEGHRADLSDLPANKAWRSQKLGAPIGSQGILGRHLILGETGTAIIDGLEPRAGEPIVSKPGKSGFINTDLDQILRKRGIRNLIFAGVTTDGAVQCTLRDANDRGYECLLLEDASASDVAAHHADQVHTLSLAGGHYGSIATVDALAQSLASGSANP